jgi:hypothetical protein
MPLMDPRGAPIVAELGSRRRDEGRRLCPRWGVLLAVVSVASQSRRSSPLKGARPPAPCAGRLCRDLSLWKGHGNGGESGRSSSPPISTLSAKAMPPSWQYFSRLRRTVLHTGLCVRQSRSMFAAARRLTRSLRHFALIASGGCRFESG